MKVTDRTQVKRGRKRANYDTETIYQILDDAFMCHIGGNIDGFPCVQPNLHWRVGNRLYIHGSVKNALISSILEDEKVCITVSHLDGLVLAKSAFHHSVNYRSVMIFGKPTLIEDDGKKSDLLDALVEKCKEGRSKECRPANATELKATSVIEIPIEEASAKIRTGGPVDDPEDMELPYWTGVIPIHTNFGEPEEY